VNLLLEDPGGSSSPASSTWTQKQHDMALARLTRIGNQLPQDFKRILSESPELKRRIEQALLKSQEQERARLLEKQQQHQVVSQPSIKLKTDFSNFA